MSQLEERIDTWYGSEAKNLLKTPVNRESILNAINVKNGFSLDRVKNLLSHDTVEFLENMAISAKKTREQYFGNTIKLFTPLYISNYCQNGCLYCAFKQDNKISRKQLSQDELEKECLAVSKSGIRHILVLTGEAPGVATFDFLKSSLKKVNSHFSSTSIEVYPIEQSEYKELVDDAGLDGLTIYQETYSKDAYKINHPYGQKSDYSWRLNCPERGAKAGIRTITLGSLLGLDDPFLELGALAIHIDYLQKKYPEVEFTVSFPRLRPIVGSSFDVKYPISDKFYAQILLAFRLLFPHIGITLSTRESEQMRNGLIPLGVTKISAGVSTSVGDSSTDDPSDEQFDIADERSVDEICNWLGQNGFQPVLHDWDSKLISDEQ